MPSKTSPHPRRRQGSPSTTAALIDSFAGLSIQKGTTFHSPSSNKSELFNPLDAVARSMTTRSVTSPKALEDLLIGAGERRAADLLAKVDQVIADNNSAAALGKLLSEPEALPHPRCVLDNADLDSIIEERRDTLNNAYDSGLGSSIADSDEFDTKNQGYDQRLHVEEISFSNLGLLRRRTPQRVCMRTDPQSDCQAYSPRTKSQGLPSPYQRCSSTCRLSPDHHPSRPREDAGLFGS